MKNKKKVRFFAILIAIIFILFISCEPNDSGDSGDTGDSGVGGDGGTPTGRYIPAEWEELEGVWFVWVDETYMKTAIREVSEITKAYIMRLSEESEQYIRNTLTSFGGVNLDNIQIYLYNGSKPYSEWIRDFGPYYFFDGDGQRKILDFHHTYWCDDMPIIISNYTGIALIDVNTIELPGGMYISDGVSQQIMSKAIYQVPLPSFGNQYVWNIDHYSSKEAFLDALEAFTGMETTVLVDYIYNENTHHTDMWAKQLSLTTFLVGEYASGDNVAVTNNVASQLTNLGYTIIRITQHPQGSTKVTSEILKKHRDAEYLIKTNAKFLLTTRSYTNSLFVNGGTNGKKVLVPSYSGYTDLNNNAQSIYENAFPDWEIVMIDCSEIIIYGGAIHCTTMQVPVDKNL